MPYRRGVLTAFMAGLAGCWSDSGDGSRRTPPSGRRAGHRSTPSTPAPATPRSSPLSVDEGFRWAAPYYDSAHTLRVPTSVPRDDPQVLWEATLDGFGSEPRIDGEHLLTFGDRKLLVVDRRTGRVLRSTALEREPVSAPTLVDDGFVAGVQTDDDERSVARFDRSGRVVWEFDTGRESFYGPTVTQQRAYVAAGESLVALDVETGEEVWRHASEDGDVLASRPAIAAGVVYATGIQQSLYEVDAESGERNWRYFTGTYNAYSTVPTVGDYLVFTGSGSSVAIGRELGVRAWSASAGAATSHALAGDRLVTATSEGTVMALSRRLGTVEWAVDGATGTPVVTDESVLVRGPSGTSAPIRVLALDRQDGSTRWQRKLSSRGWAIAADGHVYLNRRGGVVQCLG